jgi:D-alanyl-D-alanine carboxypeptidase
VAYELLDPSDIVTITDEAIRTEGDSGLLKGETFTVQNLTDLTLIESSNDGAAALAINAGSAVMPEAEKGSSVFISAMNLKAKELGLTETRYYNSTGLDLSETEAGAYGSARDMAHLMEYLITTHPDAAALTTLDSKTIYDTDGRYHLVKNTNEVVGDIDGLIASKTGYTLLSGGNLVIAVNVGLNHPVIIAVLGSSTSGRFTDALTLLEEARSAVEKDT